MFNVMGKALSVEQSCTRTDFFFKFFSLYSFMDSHIHGQTSELNYDYVREKITENLYTRESIS